MGGKKRNKKQQPRMAVQGQQIMTVYRMRVKGRSHQQLWIVSVWIDYVTLVK